MLHPQEAGLADYSGLFRFGSPGTHCVRVIVAPNPVEARFTVHPVI